ncbi:unnamed protein product [Rotaria socialis]|uniref:Uncharacterized protein n=2 Tax=Rotaria socialis TaxID=392032 RepID=A0A821LB77_9BILA|nr:unnamed protein product [Rotaria socialis]CAF4748735.1 unnamed protein product [Rotaria socialis]
MNISASALQLVCGFFGTDLPRFKISNNLNQLVQVFSTTNQLPFFTTYHIYPNETYCVKCNKIFDSSSRLARVVHLYLGSGEIVNAVVHFYTCKHQHTKFSSDNPVTYFPSYYVTQTNLIKERRFTQSHIIGSKYIYFGGHYAFETSLLRDYLMLFAIGAITIYAFVDVYNFKHRLVVNDDQKLDRKLFIRTILSFALIQFLFFMDYQNVDVPYNCSGKDIDMFFLSMSAYRSCIICQTMETPEYEHFMIGCDRSPLNGHEYCADHVHKYHSEQTHVVPEDDDDDYTSLRNGKRRMSYHQLSCNTKKLKPESYISNCHRTFGIIIYVFNCNVLLAVHEIMRSETIKEVLAGLCDIIRVSSDNTNTLQPGEMASSWLPKTIVYDDCCHVVKHIIDYFPNYFRQTPASTFLYHSSFTIDAYHYRNHTDKWCQQYLNPNENEVVKRFNTQSAEQSNSWIKRFAKQFKSDSALSDIALINNHIGFEGQQQPINNPNYISTRELMSSSTDDHFDGLPLPPFTQFKKKHIQQQSDHDHPNKRPNLYTTTEVEHTSIQSPDSIISSQLTPNQLLHLSQAHISSTYDLRTHQQSETPAQNLQLRRLSLSDTDDQQIDLFCGGETTPQQAILLQKVSNHNNTIDNLRSKTYKDYSMDNSQHLDSRLPKHHKFE